MKASSIRAVMRGEPPFDPFGGELFETDGVAESMLAALAECRAERDAAMNELRERNEDMAEWRPKYEVMEAELAAARELRDAAMSELAAAKELLGGAENLGEFSELVGPDYRAKYAELRAQVRYLADDMDSWGPGLTAYRRTYFRLRELTGPWPHEVKP